MLATKLSTSVSVSCVLSSPSAKPAGTFVRLPKSPSKSSEEFVSQPVKATVFPLAILKSVPDSERFWLSVKSPTTCNGLPEVPSPLNVALLSTTCEPHWSPPEPVGSITVLPSVIVNWFPETDRVCNSFVSSPSASAVKNPLFETNASTSDSVKCVSVSVNEPPPFESVTVFPFFEMVCNSFVSSPSCSVVKYPLLATKLSTSVSVSCVLSSPSASPAGTFERLLNSPSKSSEASVSQPVKVTVFPLAILKSVPDSERFWSSVKSPTTCSGLAKVPSPERVASLSTVCEPHWSPPDPVGSVTTFPSEMVNWFPETDNVCNSFVSSPSCSAVKNPLFATKLSTSVSVSCVLSSPSANPAGTFKRLLNSPSKSSEASVSQPVKVTVFPLAILKSVPDSERFWSSVKSPTTCSGLAKVPSPERVASLSTVCEPHWSPPDPVGSVTTFPSEMVNWFPETDNVCNSFVGSASASTVK